MNRLRRHDRRGGTLGWVLVGLALVGLAAWAAWAAKGGERPAEAPVRQAAYETAVSAVQTEAWPETPREVIEAFWQAANEKDYARMTVLCPGSLEADYRKYYDQWTPSPARSVGPGQPVAGETGVTLYPVTIDFPGYEGKTVKMAVRTLEDGRLAIDGQHTVWW